MSALSVRINAANTEGLNSREIAARATALGAKVSHGAINTVLNGKHGDVKDTTLRALSKVFHIDFGELRELLGLPSIDEPWAPPENAARLTHRQRQIVESLINELTKPARVTITMREDVGEDVALPASIETQPS